MFAEYQALLTRRLKINGEYGRLFHPIRLPPQITGSYTRFLSCGRSISGEGTRSDHSPKGEGQAAPRASCRRIKAGNDNERSVKPQLKSNSQRTFCRLPRLVCSVEGTSIHCNGLVARRPTASERRNRQLQCRTQGRGWLCRRPRQQGRISPFYRRVA